MGKRNHKAARDAKLNALNRPEDEPELPVALEKSLSDQCDQPLPQRVDTTTASSTHDTIRTTLICEDSHIFLLQRLFSEPRLPEDDEVRKYVKELGLISSAGSPELAESMEWTVENGNVSSLASLPDHEKHSGSFEWIGQEREKYPTYLWDSHEDRTIWATADILEQGYIAVSWTWGRYQKRDPDGEKEFRPSSSVRWQLPVIPEEGPDLIRALKTCLRTIREYRYFWVDVLCIHQQKEDEKLHEIEKQAGIFDGAKAAICFLWTLDQPEHFVDPLKGLGELLDWALNFSQREKEKNDVNKWADSFDRLRDENWFSSLWALQEIVLAPAGVWMTRTGDICYLNKRVLTTRLMATILRLLCWTERRRAELWMRAESDYAWTHGISQKHLTKVKGTQRRRRIEKRKAMQNAVKFQNQLSSAYENGYSLPGALGQSLRPSLLSLILGRAGLNEVQDQTRPADLSRSVTFDKNLPWVLARQDAEESLRKQISYWTDWAFGTACIDVSLSATRAAIIIAATNRSIVKGNAREPAILAALKVEPDEQLLGKNATSPPRHVRVSSKHLSSALINVILKEEGLGLFNVAHGVVQHTIPRIASDDFVLVNWPPPMDSHFNIPRARGENTGPHATSRSAWQHPTRQLTRLSDLEFYLHRGECKPTRKLPGNGSALSDMSPDTASAMNLQILPFDSTKLYTWLSSEGWHVHSDSGLHVPHGAETQTVPERRRRHQKKAAALVRLNGLEGDVYEVKIHSENDLNIICKTQDWLVRLLGPMKGKLKARFLFLPLGFHQQTSPLSTQSRSFDDVTPIGKYSIGIVLVTKASSTRDQSMTCWYKLGTYAGTAEMENSTLTWTDGIIVTSYLGEGEINTREPLHCEAVRNEAKQILGRLAEFKKPKLKSFGTIFDDSKTRPADPSLLVSIGKSIRRGIKLW